MNNLCQKCIRIYDEEIWWYQSEQIVEERRNLLFVHGIASQANHWIPMIREFQSLYNIYILDRPGYGNSGLIQSKSMDQYCELLITIIKKMDISFPVTYIGHSMGAYLGLELSLKEKLFDKMILISSFSSYVVDNNLILQKEFCQEKVIKLLRNSFSKNTDEKIINQYLKDVRNMENEAIWNDFFLISNSKIEEEILQKIEIPIYILHAFDDKVVSTRKGQLVARALNKSKLFFLKEGGHNFFVSSPKRTGKIIEECIIELN